MVEIKESQLGAGIENGRILTLSGLCEGVIWGRIVLWKGKILSHGGGSFFLTRRMTASIAGADENSLNPSKAGFTLYSGDGAPSITFGVQDGKLGISGIN